jgi:hypothetical protein
MIEAQGVLGDGAFFFFDATFARKLQQNIAQLPEWFCFPDIGLEMV